MELESSNQTLLYVADFLLIAALPWWKTKAAKTDPFMCLSSPSPSVSLLIAPPISSSPSRYGIRPDLAPSSSPPNGLLINSDFRILEEEPYSKAAARGWPLNSFVIAFWIGGVENKCHWLSNLGWLFHTRKIHGVEAAAAE